MVPRLDWIREDPNSKIDWLPALSPLGSIACCSSIFKRLNIQFGRFVAQLRKEQNLTQKELAERLHVTDKAVSKWETGKGFPDLKLLEPLAQVLNVSLVELLQGERTPSPTLTKEEAGQAAVQAMEQSQKNTARRYLKLFRWLLTGIGVWCLLSCLPWGTILLAQILPSTSIGVIGGADGPTQIYVSASDTAFPPQFYLLTQLAALIVCIVLAVQVWRLERRLK